MICYVFVILVKEDVLGFLWFLFLFGRLGLGLGLELRLGVGELVTWLGLARGFLGLGEVGIFVCECRLFVDFAS